MQLLQVLLAAVIGLAALVVLPWDIGVLPGPLPHSKSNTPASEPLDTPAYSRQVLQFPCSGELCEAWLYVPKDVSGLPPVVILGHGLGGQKDMGLNKYCEAFAAAGLASFAIDYRNFGGSSGEPRNWVSPQRHVEDWLSAVAYVQSELADRVNTQRLALWGSSYGGGHALVVASKLGRNVSAVVSQVPHLDGKRVAKVSIRQRGLLQMLRMLVAGVHDRIRTAAAQPPAYLPLVGSPGSMAFMQLNEFELSEYYSKHPSEYQGGWRNMARASLVLEAARYSPILSVPQITAPVLFIGASKDTLCPPDLVQQAAGLAPHGRVFMLDVTHFELYRGTALGMVLEQQIEHLQQHLSVARRATADG